MLSIKLIALSFLSLMQSSNVYYPNGRLAWNGSYGYHENGRTAWSGSYAYHMNGRTAWSGTYAYYENGRTAWSGSYAYHENGQTAWSGGTVGYYANNRIAINNLVRNFDPALLTNVPYSEFKLSDTVTLIVKTYNKKVFLYRIKIGLSVLNKVDIDLMTRKVDNEIELSKNIHLVASKVPDTPDKVSLNILGVKVK